MMTWYDLEVVARERQRDLWQEAALQRAMAQLSALSPRERAAAMLIALALRIAPAAREADAPDVATGAARA